MPSKHAKLSPSGAKLDLKCPGNRRMQRKYPRKSSVHSAKGTGAHKLGETCLNKGTNAADYIGHWVGETPGGNDFILGPEYTKNSFEKGVFAFKVDAKMAGDVQLYLDTVRQIAAGLPGHTLGIEIISELNSDRWGTCDAAVMQMYGRLHIIDYKNGVTYVEAQENPQMMIYALGLIRAAQEDGIEYSDVVMTIVQPNTKGGEAVRSFGPVAVAELLKWQNEILFPADSKCLDPNAIMSPGEWCKSGWCDARHSCPALAAHNNHAVQGMFSPAVPDRPAAPPEPITMSPEQRKIILDNRELVIDWINKVYEHEYSMHMQGQGAWGKLVKGQNSRGWYDEASAKMSLTEMLDGDIYVPAKMKSPAMAETALKARGFTAALAKALVSDLVSVKQGKLKLVSENARGASVNPVNQMFTITQ